MKVTRRDDKQSTKVWFYMFCTLLMTNILVYQVATKDLVGTTMDGTGTSSSSLLSPLSVSRDFTSKTKAASSSLPSEPEEVLRNPLSIPRGQAKALPSIRVTNDKAEAAVDRKIYGGAGDKKHLGGFTDMDKSGISPRAWKWMVQRLNIQSVLDVGCGRGLSTSWFLFHGLDVLCVEGSHDAREKTVLPDPDKQMVEHDFSRGPWWPGRTFDAVWCVEFLEHVRCLCFAVLKEV